MPPPSPRKPVAEVIRDAVSRLIAPDTRMSMARVAPTGFAVAATPVVLEKIDAPAAGPGRPTIWPSCRLPPGRGTVTEGWGVAVARPPASVAAPLSGVLGPGRRKRLAGTAEVRAGGPGR